MKHHDFQPTTLTHFTYCDRCRRFIWGLRNQALSCSACGFVCHLACGADPALICERKEELSKSPAEQALKKLQKLDDDQRYTSGEKQHEDQPNSDLHPESHPNVHPHPHLPVPNTKHAAIRFIEDLILEATLEADNRPVSEYVLNPPALNAQTTAKNFTRFIARCSFVFELRDSFILLLSWNNSMHTWLALLSYCYLCLHPVWLLLTPQAFMIYIITRNHTQRNDQNHKQSICPPEYRKSSPQTSSKGAPASPADYPTLSTPWNVASYLFAMSEDSPEYRRNLQNIQNMMGDFSDLYDYCASYAHYTSWSCESCTSLALQLVIFSGLVTVAFIYILPLKQIMLFSGVFVFFLNTRFVKSLLLIAHSNEWPTQILAEIRTRYRRWTIDSASTHRDIRPVSIYENQRWHDAAGKRRSVCMVKYIRSYARG
ncbi:integral peroxisomal membrane peroxin-domain-containing protein [Syncephalastrum racemosum]|uniref:Integral peroxisomal membrane peroxin-domain-containing protein n=1 Tax=Syncephalastrum racemosum TaxID=13706 RepID=A0A1X2HF64_SYNRA|nr:integral peroxisomal membrane peroxin-domain-containing protein [Syncephalastrum racemosum]